jgi:hypothetical protein
VQSIPFYLFPSNSGGRLIWVAENEAITILRSLRYFHAAAITTDADVWFPPNPQYLLNVGVYLATHSPASSLCQREIVAVLIATGSIAAGYATEPPVIVIVS